MTCDTMVKDVAAPLRLTMPWPELFGAAVASSEWAVTPAGLSFSGAAFESDAAFATVNGGVMFASYLVSNRIVTTGGETFLKTILVRVDQVHAPFDVGAPAVGAAALMLSVPLVDGAGAGGALAPAAIGAGALALSVPLVDGAGSGGALAPAAIGAGAVALSVPTVDGAGGGAALALNPLTITLSAPTIAAEAAPGTTVATVSGWAPSTVAGGRELIGTTLLALNAAGDAVVVGVDGLLSAAGTTISGWSLRETNAAASNSPLTTAGPDVPVDAAAAISLVSVDARGMSGLAAADISGPTKLATPVPISVQRQGFTAGGVTTTHTETIYIQARLREPYPVSDQNNRIPTARGVVFSENITRTDVVPGVTNNSTLEIPRPAASWVEFPMEVAGNVLSLGITVGHTHTRAGQLAACVRLQVTDGTTTLEQFVNAPVSQVQPTSGLSLIVWRHVFDISGFADGTALTCHARVYPWYGDAASVLDTADDPGTTWGERFIGFGPVAVTKHAGVAAAPVLVYVSPTTGSDTTGVASTTAATALAAPFATISAASAAGRALSNSTYAYNNNGGIRVRLLEDATISDMSVPGWLIVETDPDLPTPVNLNYDADLVGILFRPKRVNLRRTGTATISSCQMENVSYDPGSTTSGSRINRSDTYTIARGFKLLAAADLNFFGPPASASGGMLTIIDADLTFFWPGRLPAMHLQAIRTSSGMGLTVAASYTRPRGMHIEAIYGSITGTDMLMFPGDVSHGTHPIYTLNCMFERLESNDINFFGISSDGQSYSTYAVAHHYLTLPGNLWARANNAYDENTTVARNHPWFVETRSIHGRSATKGDLFVNDGTRQGSWWWEYQVGSRDNVWIYDFNFEFTSNNLNSVGGTMGSLDLDPGFLNPQVPTSSGGPAGAGGGDYRVLSTSPAASRDSAPAVGWDVFGNPRVAGGPVGALGVLAP